MQACKGLRNPLSLTAPISAWPRRWNSSPAHEAFASWRARAAEAAQRAGFVDRQAVLPTGEPMNFLERPPVGGGPASSVVVFIHGMTNDRVMSAASFARTATLLPRARCLLPDALGHGSRMPWAMRPSFQARCDTLSGSGCILER